VSRKLGAWCCSSLSARAKMRPPTRSSTPQAAWCVSALPVWYRKQLAAGKKGTCSTSPRVPANRHALEFRVSTVKSQCGCSACWESRGLSTNCGSADCLGCGQPRWASVYVYYWRTCKKAVCGGGGNGGHVLKDTLAAVCVDESGHLALVNAGYSL